MFRQAISYAGSEPLHQQLDLLTEIQKSGDELGSALASLGISYNDLRYEVANKRAWNGPKPQGLGDVKKVGGGVPFVSFSLAVAESILGLKPPDLCTMPRLR